MYERYRRFILLPLLLFAAGHAGGEGGVDEVIIARTEGLPGPKGPAPAARKFVVKGRDLARIRKPVAALVMILSDEDPWTDIGPDAPALAAEIRFQGKIYHVASWYPIYRDNPKIAVSDNRGLVSVTSPEEKAQIEAGNNADYKTMEAFWDAVLANFPQVGRSP
jgi:hypothetical protein